ncbi:Ig-like domain-containing protein [Subtercola vilae]|uniref:SbsA Ig-like domain-containing protein n=1 Tax=Subtercola vilae TaxID=2056433 RepID=A0A4T2BK09_9MICO|nr:Ig-like domain-containing protein [Subtercola vilae]TIH30261.1 hypothetical protein D4765_17190 [Subtercola vilae]
MSTDARRFRRLLYGSIGGITLVVAALVGANLVQGPHVTSAQINLQTSVERSGQRLLLQANEPLAALDPAQVSVSPAVAVTPTVSGASISLQFAGVLQYNTTYTVNVARVKSISSDATSTFAYSFTTPDAALYVLVPGQPGQPDTIAAAGLSGAAPRTVYSAANILRFVAFPDSLVVNTRNDDGSDALTIVSLSTGAAIPVQVAGPGTITSLRASVSSHLFGYTFTASPSPYFSTPANLLFAYDLTRGQDFPIPITGLDREQISPAEWSFVPSTTSLVARGADDSLVLVDAIGEREGSSAAVAIGQAAALGGFVPDTKTLLAVGGGAGGAGAGAVLPNTQFDLSAKAPVAAPFAAAAVVGDSGTATSTSAAAGTTETQTQTQTTFLDSAGAYLRLAANAGGSGGSGELRIERVDATAATTVFTPPTAQPAVTAFCVSPNGKYLAVQTSSATGAGGGAASTAAGASTSVSFVDLETDAQVSTLPGEQPNWCSS